VSLLNEKKIDFTIVEYLKTPLSKSEILSLADKLGKHPKEFVRTKEKEFIDNNFRNIVENGDVLADAIASYPKILERPIAVLGDKAVIGRPPELVLTLLS